MRRHDKKQNIRKANLLFEKRCNESKGLINESSDEDIKYDFLDNYPKSNPDSNDNNKDFLSNLKLKDIHTFNNDKKLDDFISKNKESIKMSYQTMLDQTFDSENITFRDWAEFILKSHKNSKMNKDLSLNEED